MFVRQLFITIIYLEIRGNGYAAHLYGSYRWWFDNIMTLSDYCCHLNVSVTLLLVIDITFYSLFLFYHIINYLRITKHAHNYPTTKAIQIQQRFSMTTTPLFCFHKIISLYFKLQSTIYSHTCNSINITYKILFHSAILEYIHHYTDHITHKLPPILINTQMRTIVQYNRGHQHISHKSQPILINTQMRISFIQYNRGH